MRPQYTVELDDQQRVWVRCTAHNPVPRQGTHPAAKARYHFAGMMIFHPDATVIATEDREGVQEHYQCPHCGLTWWTERDG